MKTIAGAPEFLDNYGCSSGTKLYSQSRRFQRPAWHGQPVVKITSTSEHKNGSSLRSYINLCMRHHASSRRSKAPSKHGSTHFYAWESIAALAIGQKCDSAKKRFELTLVFIDLSGLTARGARSFKAWAIDEWASTPLVNKSFLRELAREHPMEGIRLSLAYIIFGNTHVVGATNGMLSSLSKEPSKWFGTRAPSTDSATLQLQSLFARMTASVDWIPQQRGYSDFSSPLNADESKIVSGVLKSDCQMKDLEDRWDTMQLEEIDEPTFAMLVEEVLHLSAVSNRLFLVSPPIAPFARDRSKPSRYRSVLAEMRRRIGHEIIDLRYNPKIYEAGFGDFEHLLGRGAAILTTELANILVPRLMAVR